MARKLITGRCKLCLKTKELNFEHIPPRSAFNKQTNFYSIDKTEYYQNAKDYTFGKLKPKSKKEQGGIGKYSFCIECNGYLGSKYVRNYKLFAHIAMDILQSNKTKARCFKFDISDIDLLKFIKQITAIFIASNNHSFTKCYPELLNFVKDEKSSHLDDKYRFYMYLNNEGKNRTGTIHYINNYGAVCDFAFSPFGFVLNIDNPNTIDILTDITSFKHYKQQQSSENMLITLNKLPTYYPFPLDYRDKDKLR